MKRYVRYSKILYSKTDQTSSIVLTANKIRLNTNERTTSLLERFQRKQHPPPLTISPSPAGSSEPADSAHPLASITRPACVYTQCDYDTGAASQ